MKEEITSQRKIFKVDVKCDSEKQETLAFILLYYFEQVFVAGFVYFLFPSLLIISINVFKLKPSRLK